ncbi:hypothetical protein CYMTET_41534 [Cymbomonas tetramitiformis]|uniref:Uncharacterized protein n=1 Tax=Cymbomonas tetramitiformis TaxID=36881 RepID=A0AAE0C5W2_9CHLO|nr:hypothetical protein CYMTET_41534 [Cymbomonas tetramitiformis]
MVWQKRSREDQCSDRNNELSDTARGLGYAARSATSSAQLLFDPVNRKVVRRMPACVLLLLYADGLVVAGNFYGWCTTMAAAPALCTVSAAWGPQLSAAPALCTVSAAWGPQLSAAPALCTVSAASQLQTRSAQHSAYTVSAPQLLQGLRLHGQRSLGPAALWRLHCARSAQPGARSSLQRLHCARSAQPGARSSLQRLHCARSAQPGARSSLARSCSHICTAWELGALELALRAAAARGRSGMCVPSSKGMDANCAGCKLTRKSTSKAAGFLCGKSGVLLVYPPEVAAAAAAAAAEAVLVAAVEVVVVVAHHLGQSLSHESESEI